MRAEALTFYRLNPDKVDPPKAIRPGRDFFLLVYKIATEQCTDLGSDTKSSDLGAEELAMSQIIHPDHPDSKRDSHQDHMHFQIGAAFW